MHDAPLTIADFSAADLTAHLADLSRLLVSVVAAGASINFVLPYGEADAARFWEKKVLPRLEEGGIIMLVARQGDAIVGSVQLVIDTPPNQPHRADVAKLIVDPACRRQGIARRLMEALEARALAERRTLITLDTRTGDAAEPLYAGLGYTTVGTIPGYARDPFGSDRLDATTIMYKAL
ncbi:GNAT family N-acetyltransferase [Acuticoccus kandeliae]|uniref:GNAT family N-acetyltransferase n=1 Tax=Acuticoccus kandeliae TaxID=2073160 RepID=UPI000D3E86E8|nr:GNAT family N-acetyltransferase [Acuticoccus kandeliae]